MTSRLQVNWIACEAHGICDELFPVRGESGTVPARRVSGSAE
jgi:hypothetical protein